MDLLLRRCSGVRGPSTSPVPALLLPGSRAGRSRSCLASGSGRLDDGQDQAASDTASTLQALSEYRCTDASQDEPGVKPAGGSDRECSDQFKDGLTGFVVAFCVAVLWGQSQTTQHQVHQSRPRWRSGQGWIPGPTPGGSRSSLGCARERTERVGFEPTDAFTSLVFKTRAINHSTTSPPF